jgi:hypothetical protein
MQSKKTLEVQAGVSETIQRKEICDVCIAWKKKGEEEESMPHLSFTYASGPRMAKATTSRSTQNTNWLIPPLNASFAIT